MDEYIEREAAYHVFSTNNALSGFEKAYCREIIRNIPAADVAPVRHGRWFDKGSLSCRCSKCGCKNYKETKWCPNCGCKMELEG